MYYSLKSVVRIGLVTLAACTATLFCASSAPAAAIPINTNTLEDSQATDQAFLGSTISLYMFDSVQYDYNSTTYTITASQLNGAELMDFRDNNTVERGINLRLPETYASTSPIPADPQAVGPQRTEMAIYLSTESGYGQLPRGTDTDLDPSTSNGAKFVFELPVRNLVGPDILIIEDGSGDNILIEGIDFGSTTYEVPTGSTYWGGDTPGRKMCVGNNMYKYASMTELKTNTNGASSAWTSAHDRAGTLIDLSDLGYGADAVCTGIFIQCKAQVDANANRLDPMIIGGLNAIPEPATLVLLATGVLALIFFALRRRKRR